MANSLQDQLLKAGLANAKQAKKPKAAKPHEKAKKGERGPVSSEAALAAQQALAEKAERDRQLNLERKAEAERKALAAQLRQLVEQHRIAREGAEEPYHFVDEGRVRMLRVTPALRERLAQGRVEIVRIEGRYELVPADVAEKIRARDPQSVVARPKAKAAPEGDDPYAAYQVPDDLMW